MRGGLACLVSQITSGDLCAQDGSKFELIAMVVCGCAVSRAVMKPMLVARFGAGDAY